MVRDCKGRADVNVLNQSKDTQSGMGKVGMGQATFVPTHDLKMGFAMTMTIL